MVGLRDIRKDRGLSQTELAEKVKWADPTADQTMISILERGDLYPSAKLMTALCVALDCAESELYDGVESMFVPAPDAKISYTTARLAELITFGAENAISRTELRMITGWKDRVLRKNIQKAREEGVVICNEQNGGGYYFPQTQRELFAQYKANKNRAMSILRQQKYIRMRMWEATNEP